MARENEKIRKLRVMFLTTVDLFFLTVHLAQMAVIGMSHKTQFGFTPDRGDMNKA